MNSNRLDDLRARLRAPSEKIPPSFQRLGNALWNPDEDATPHEQCREALPSLILAQMSGEPLAEELQPVKQHLDHCDECGTEYAELLDIAMAEQRGALAHPAKIPRPDLAFLPTQESSVQTLVLAWVRTLLSEIAPNTLPELNVIAAPFFKLAEPLRGTIVLRASESRALYFTGGEITPALQALALAFATARQFEELVTSAQLNQWAKQGILKHELEARIRDVAKQIGIEDKPAIQLANALAGVLAENPDSLKRLFTSA